jgi:hypothetical protein
MVIGFIHAITITGMPASVVWVLYLVLMMTPAKLLTKNTYHHRVAAVNEMNCSPGIFEHFI